MMMMRSSVVSSLVLRAVTKKTMSDSLRSGVRACSSASPSEYLSKIIESEIEVAKTEQEEMRGESGDLNDALAQTGFELHDKQGDIEFTLTRKHGEENVLISVNVEEVDSSVSSSELEGIDGLDFAEQEEETSEEDEDGVNSVYFSARISKAGSSKEMLFNCLADDEGVGIESVRFLKAGQVADEATYAGPNFEDLDERLQEALHSFLADRGVDGSVGEFISAYAFMKENGLYMRWLENLDEFA